MQEEGRKEVNKGWQKDHRKETIYLFFYQLDMDTSSVYEKEQLAFIGEGSLKPESESCCAVLLKAHASSDFIPLHLLKI